MTPRRVLVAFNGTPSAHRAVATAIDLARTNSARLTVIAAVEAPSDILFGSMTSVEFGDLRAPAQRSCRAMLDRVVSGVSDDVPTTGVLGYGAPWKAITEEVRAGGHDLVVMGSRGRGRLAALLFGSVSRDVVARSPVPVLLVRALAHGPDADPAPVGGEPYLLGQPCASR